LPQHGEVWWCELADVERLPSEVLLEPGEDPVPRPCVASLDSVESVSLAALVGRLGRLSPVRMRSICNALAVAVDCR
jgi:mRNA interferase MazF